MKEANFVLAVEAHFWELCDRAARHDDRSMQMYGDDSVPPAQAHLEAQASELAMVEIIGLVEHHPEHHVTFVRCFSDLVLWKRPAPYLLVAFCMRRLRFPEVQDLIHRDAEAHIGTAYYASHMNFWSAIIHACLDEIWENADCFDFYRHEFDDDQSQRRTKT